MKWLKNQGNNIYLLTCSDKIIKLWKVNTKYKKELMEHSSSGVTISVPKIRVVNKFYNNTLRKSYSNLHNYHINSLSLSSNCENFISSDDLSVYLWNLDREDECQNLIDIKPSNLKQVSEVITTSKYQTTNDYEYSYATSRGNVVRMDMRMSSKIQPVACLKAKRPSLVGTSTQSTLDHDEIISCVTDIEYSPDGSLIFARDLLSVTVWDLANTSSPLKQIELFKSNLAKLDTLNNNEAIYEKYQITTNRLGNEFATGTLNGFVVGGYEGTDMYQYYLPERQPEFEEFSITSKKQDMSNKFEAVGPDRLLDLESDFSKRVINLAWNPKYDMVVAASKGSLYFYNRPEKDNKSQSPRKFL